MRTPYLFLTLLLGLTLTTCAQKHSARNNKPVVTQGICGTVVEKRGNYMPSPDVTRPNSSGTPAECQVLIFPVLNRSRVDAGENGFITSVRGVKPVKTVKSGKDGKFCVSLPVGQYSVVVQEPQGLYANLFDNQNNIFRCGLRKAKRHR